MNVRDLLIGASIGAALAYVADPNMGRRRRALARDQLVRASHKTRDALDATARDLGNRTAGVMAETRRRLTQEELDDVRLVERVRARLGRVCSHPRVTEVEAKNGTVTLRGPILAREKDRVLSEVAAVRGVRAVTDAFEVHESADTVPSLQGEGNVAGPRLDILQRNWAPATQALLAAASLVATGAVVAYARRH
jgi:gas vesicle protein